MAEVLGHKEAQAALVKVNKIIKEVKEINQFLSIENPTTTYYLSFTIKNPNLQEEPEVKTHEDVIPLQGPTTDSPELPVQGENASENAAVVTEDAGKKRRTKTKNTIQYSTPLLCDNKDGLYHFIHLYKERKVRTALQLAEMHRLGFSSEDKKILGLS